MWKDPGGSTDLHLAWLLLDEQRDKMSRWQWLALALLGGLTAGIVAVFVRVPGYMDAEYYYATATQLADGHGFVEPFLWNYLEGPLALPHPSHLYWMPLTSLLAAVGPALLQGGFRSAQIPFVLLTAGLPVLTAWIASRWLHATPGPAFLAGVLAAFSGFYLPFLVTTDAFAPYAWIGTLALTFGAAAYRTGRRELWLVAGLATGAAQLARADGLLLMLPLLALALPSPRRVTAAAGLLLGWGVILGPWLARNFSLTGSAFATGGARTLWLTRYDELFSYPASILEPARWWSQGIVSLLSARLQALGTNLTTLIVVVGSIVLSPFMLVGLWHFRKEPIVTASGSYLILLLTAMTLAFPFSGARGGVFHSAAAVLPVLWAVTPAGLKAALDWVASRRRWDPERARRLFVPVVLAFVALISAWVVWDRVIAGWPRNPGWELSDTRHRTVAQALFGLDASPGVVAINNPPGFYVASGLPSVVVPFGNLQALRAVVDRFGVEWVVLDANTPEPLLPLYQEPGSVPWLLLRGRLEDAQGRPIYLLQVLAQHASPA